MTVTAGDRFRRLLEILPRIADRSDVPIADLARDVGVEPRVLMADLRALAERYDEPGGFVAGVSVLLDGDRVSVRANHFHRPMRLSASELCAIEVGLGILAREQDPEAAARITRLRGKLDQLITALPADNAHAGLRDGALGDGAQAGILSQLREALRRSRVIMMAYRKSFSADVDERALHPHQLRFADGAWYLVGWCVRSAQVKVFRVDRMAGVTVTDEPITHGADAESMPGIEGGTPFVPPPGLSTFTVRYSPVIARWIVEQDGGPLEADGSATRTRPLADREWALRQVLQYGSEATILEPSDLREELVTRLRAMASG